MLQRGRLHNMLSKQAVGDVILAIGKTRLDTAEGNNQTILPITFALSACASQRLYLLQLSTSIVCWVVAFTVCTRVCVCGCVRVRVRCVRARACVCVCAGCQAGPACSVQCAVCTATVDHDDSNWC